MALGQRSKMGSYAGHVYPGVFLLIYGITWCSLSFWLHLTSSSSSKPKDRSKKYARLQHDKLNEKSWLPMIGCPNLPIEPMIKIILPALAILVEAFLDLNSEGHIIGRVYKAFDSEGKIRDQGKFHHITMHFGFLMSGVVDILSLFINLPKPTSMLFLSLAFSVEFLIFYLHTAHDVFYVHSILVFLAFLSLVFSLLRLLDASNLIINLGLGNCLILQGAWLFQAAYFLYGDFKNEQIDTIPSASDTHTHGAAEEHTYHSVKMFIIAIFAWHIMLTAISNLILWFILSLASKEKILKRASNIRHEVPSSPEECEKLDPISNA